MTAWVATEGNDALREALALYRGIEADYIAALATTGIDFETYDDKRSEKEGLLSRLCKRGARMRNGDASIVLGSLSPGCVACTGSCVSRTFAITNDCHRDCYFCFNPNQIDFAYHCEHDFPWRKDLDDLLAEGDPSNVKAIALSGGEPMLRPEEAYAFFKRAGELFPDVYLRIYTAGDLLTEDSLRKLRDSGLDEIRFSVKQEDPSRVLQKVLSNIELAKTIIPAVVVEMPVIPKTEGQMRGLLQRFADIGIHAVNLLEFTYAMWNWEAFKARGFSLKNPPYDVVYDYVYAGALAVQGSEELCLRLMIWAHDQGLQLGIHYCSLENKHRAQLRNENEQHASLNPCYVLDYSDFFLKTAVVFGPDRMPVLEELKRCGCRDFIQDERAQALSFSPRWLGIASNVHRCDGKLVQPCISYNVISKNGGESCFRELKLELAGNENLVQFADDTASDDEIAGYGW